MVNRIVNSRTGLLICIPTLGRPVTLKWSWAFKSLVPPINYNTNFLQIYGKPVADARNDAAEAAIAQNTKYLMFIGDDTVLPPHALKQLIFRMEHDQHLGVVGGIYFSKSSPSAPLVFKENGAGSYWDWKVGEYFPVTGLGMDCTLIRTDVFKNLSKPWFKTVEEDLFLDGKNKADMWTEDLYFLKKVIEETDYGVYADASIICEHEDVYSGKTYGMVPNSLPTRQLEVKKEKKMIDIGCGPINRSNDFPDYELVRVDIREDVEPDYRCDVRTLPFANNEFDLVFSSHVLEHIPRAEFAMVLDEWLRVLKPDGKLILCLPDIEWAASRIVAGKIDHHVLNVLYGAQTNPFDYHYNGLTKDLLSSALTDRGLTVTSCKNIGETYNMVIEAVNAFMVEEATEKKKRKKE